MKKWVLVLVMLMVMVSLAYAGERRCKNETNIYNAYLNDKEHQVQTGAELDVIAWQNENKNLSVGPHYIAVINRGERVNHTILAKVTWNLWEGFLKKK